MVIGHRRVRSRGPVENITFEEQLHALAECKLAIIMHGEGYCAKYIECMDVHDIKF